MKKDIEESLDKIAAIVVNTYLLDKDSAGSAADELIELIIEMGSLGANEYHSEISRALEMLGKLHGALDAECRFFDYVKAFIAFASGEYEAYLHSIEIYIDKYIKEKKVISFESAKLDYLDIFDYVNRDASSLFFDKYFRKFHAILKKLCPDTAFERFIKYLLMQPSNPNVQERHLLGILEKDEKWAAAYVAQGSFLTTGISFGGITND